MCGQADWRTDLTNNKDRADDTDILCPEVVDHNKHCFVLTAIYKSLLSLVTHRDVWH